jgi:hypothetical protein
MARRCESLLAPALRLSQGCSGSVALVLLPCRRVCRGQARPALSRARGVEESSERRNLALTLDLNRDEPDVRFGGLDHGAVKL